ncbi:MAG TPA: hypothetical protein VIL99_17225, partial [Ignavibacteria bacterium]
MIIFKKKESIIRHRAHNYNGNFLQPLAVAIVSAVLVALILIMGFLDIQRNKTNLVGFLEDQALSTISLLQKLTEENLKSITAAPETAGSNLKTARQAESTYSKRWVVESITEMGRKLDEQWKKGKINNNYLKKFAADNNFWYLAVLDAYGHAVYESGPLQTDMLSTSELEKNGRKLTTL